MSRLSRKLFLALIFTVVVSTAFAGQQKEVKDRETVTLILSSKDPNIVAVIDDRIKQYLVVKGIATASINTKRGILNIKPAGLFNDRPFSMIVFTEKGHRYTLLFVPKKVPAQDIVLNNTENPVNDGKNNVNESGYTSKISNLIKAMIKDHEITGYKKQIVELDIKDDSKDEKTAEDESLDVKAGLKLITSYIGDDYNGEIAILKNTTNKDLNLQEEAYYGTNVVAVAFSNSRLKPLDVTKIYRVVKNG